MTHLYRGGRIVGSLQSEYTSLLVAHGSIEWIGTDAEAGALRFSGVTVTDLAGALISPGFVDAHVHATSTGLTLMGLDLSTARSRHDVLDAVARHAGGESGQLILGHGWDDSTWVDSTLPTAAELDLASDGSRVYLTRVDAHSALVSTAMLSAVPQASALRGYSELGQVTQEAHHEVRELALGSIDQATRRRAQQAFLDRVVQCGIVSVHEMAGPVISSVDDCQQLLARARDMSGPRVFAYWGELAQHGGIDTARALGARGTGGDLFVDGSLGSHTACLHDPYSDDPESIGREFIDAKALIEHVEACVLAGEQTGFHAIGDAATDAVVNAFAHVAAAHGRDLVASQRHRIEHAESLSAVSIELCARLGLVASMQPAFDSRWGGDSGMYSMRLGRARASRLNAVGEILAAGVTVAFGSDSPVTPLDPWGAVHASMNHRSPVQRIDLARALHAHTRAGWHAAGVDDAGLIRVGAPAHLAIWRSSEDAEIPAPGSTALRTIVDGDIVWDCGDLEDAAC